MDPLQQPINTTSGNSKKGLYIIIGVLALIVIGFLVRNYRNEMILERAGMGEGKITKKLNGETTYSNDYGTVTTGGTTLPKDWPVDAPAYKNATITNVVSSKQQTGLDGLTVIFTTPDSVQTILDFYKKELSANGWASVGQAPTMGNVTVISSKKGDRIFGATILNSGTGESKVTVTTATMPTGTFSR